MNVFSSAFPTMLAPGARFLGGVLLIVVAALLLGEEPLRPQFTAGQDKLEHILAFAALGFLFSVGGGAPQIARSGAFLVAAAFAAEGLQSVLTATREASSMDALAGAAGVAVGLTVATLLNMKLPRPVSA